MDKDAVASTARQGRNRLILIILAISGILVGSSAFQARQELPDQAETEAGLLRLLGIAASPESVDYVVNRTQFQLHTLLTEQRHPKTWNLSERIQNDTEAGLRLLFSVDDDIVARLETLSAEKQMLDGLTAEIEAALLGKKKIYIYGCGATGRLAKQMESSFWRPFWKKAKEAKDVWPKLQAGLDASIEEDLIGEMTGADRALISSLEGFEDLLLIGRLQLQDRGIKKGDLVICVTEGGETSSVIGTILAALDQWKAEKGYSPGESRKKLYFVYNNPDGRLLPFERSRKVIEEEGITKINLTTGPQAITGSTRMQAATIETFVIASALETGVERALRKFLSKKEMTRLGFRDESDIEDRLRQFAPLLQEIKKNVPAIAKLTDIETKTYASGFFSTYFAKAGLITVFIDSTERSPTFRLYPLDTVKEPKRKCWIQVWTEASDSKSAWQAFLGRPFRGLSPAHYQKPFEEEIDDPYLQTKALESLDKAGHDQALLYDFSFADFNLKKRGPRQGDLGVAAVLGPEAEELNRADSSFHKFAGLFSSRGAGMALVVVADAPAKENADAAKDWAFLQTKDNNPSVVIRLTVSSADDPFGVRQQITLKMLLNAHSTAVMAKLGKVIGNTMTNVSPSNLKLIGRATYLIQSHVNDVLNRPQWVRQNGVRKPVSYGEANAVLFDSIAFMKDRSKDVGQAAEVPLSIIRILESLRQKRGVMPKETLEIVQKKGLAAYLAGFK
jgi:N-acetylmuramic acid 6-phosphate (MurNAc-6-P) etherase